MERYLIKVTENGESKYYGKLVNHISMDVDINDKAKVYENGFVSEYVAKREKKNVQELLNWMNSPATAKVVTVNI